MEEPARWQLYSLLYPGSAGSLFYGVAIQSWMPEIAWDLFEDSSGVILPLPADVCRPASSSASLSSLPNPMTSVF